MAIKPFSLPFYDFYNGTFDYYTALEYNYNFYMKFGVALCSLWMLLLILSSEVIVTFDFKSEAARLLRRRAAYSKYSVTSALSLYCFLT